MVFQICIDNSCEYLPIIGMSVQTVTQRDVRKMLWMSSCISDKSSSRLDFSDCKQIKTWPFQKCRNTGGLHIRGLYIGPKAIFPLLQNYHLSPSHDMLLHPFSLYFCPFSFILNSIFPLSYLHSVFLFLCHFHPVIFYHPNLRLKSRGGLFSKTYTRTTATVCINTKCSLYE